MAVQVAGAIEALKGWKSLGVQRHVALLLLFPTLRRLQLYIMFLGRTNSEPSKSVVGVAPRHRA